MNKKSLNKITPEQISELRLEVKAIADYLYMIFFSLDRVQFRARLVGDTFYDNIIKRMDHILLILGENEEKQQKRIKNIKRKARNEHAQIQSGVTIEERFDRISKIIKATGKVAIGLGIARLALGVNVTS